MTWDPRQPFRGSGRCCLTLSPNCLPPLAIYSVCLSSGVQWLHWITLLGFCKFNFFVDLASVSLRYATELLLHLVDMARSFALGKWILFATMAGFDEDHLRRCIVYNLSNVCISTSISRWTTPIHCPAFVVPCPPSLAASPSHPTQLAPQDHTLTGTHPLPSYSPLVN